MKMIANSATRITLESANEDLEADLDPATPGRVQPIADLAGGHKLLMQVKLRNSDPWSIKEFDALLNHGTNRKPTRRHLDDPGACDCLIINADASGVVRKLLVRDQEEWPEGKDYPASLLILYPMIRRDGSQFEVSLPNGL
ncbi:MAG: hypothetical protein OXI59_12440 [Gemmatimonadota bacterium]|nr:hypothetical protein [Gemmatimonadota bacterium]